MGLKLTIYAKKFASAASDGTVETWDEERGTRTTEMPSRLGAVSPFVDVAECFGKSKNRSLRYLPENL